MESPTSHLRPLVILAGLVLVVAVLYLARGILIPITFAVLLSFPLTPIVKAAQRRGLGRMSAVLVVALFAFLVLGGIGVVLMIEVQQLANKTDTYVNNIRAKLDAMKEAGKGGVLDKIRVAVTAQHKKEESPQTDPPEPMLPDPVKNAAIPKGTPREPINVVVVNEPIRVLIPTDEGSELMQIWTTVKPLFGPASATGMVLLLTIFMLLRREDLRDRFIRLVGAGHVTTTTRAMDEAGQGISNYLLVKSLVNGGFGLILGIGLYALAVPYAILWMTLVAVLRFIPSMGVWLAAVFPAILAVAIFDDWLSVSLVVGWIVILELLTTNIVESRLLTQKIGISPVALFISLMFWTWIWGMMGLVLATPLTVCLVVLGRYVPALGFMSTLMADVPAMNAEDRFYQRLLARDQDEATEIIAAHVKEHPPEEVFDDILIPALSATRRDRELNYLSETDASFIYAATREILADLTEQVSIVQAAATAAEEVKPPTERTKILGCPAQGEADDLALQMFRQVLPLDKWDLEIVSVKTLASELLPLIEEKNPAVICIATLPPGGLSQARYLCKRLRAKFPSLKIVVGRWGIRDEAEAKAGLLKEAGADLIVHSLLETRNQVAPYVQVFQHLTQEPS